MLWAELAEMKSTSDNLDSFPEATPLLITPGDVAFFHFQVGSIAHASISHQLYSNLKVLIKKFTDN